jgi:hypothetical protein
MPTASVRKTSISGFSPPSQTSCDGIGFWSQWQSGFPLSSERSSGDRERAQPTGEPLIKESGVDHARVIADCFQHSTVLPFRFGTVFHRRRDRCASPSAPISASSSETSTSCAARTEMHIKIFVDDCCGREVEKRLSRRGRGTRIPHQSAGKCFAGAGTADAGSRGQFPNAPAVACPSMRK